MTGDIPCTDFRQPITLGRSGLRVLRLGLGSSFAAPTSAYEEAFEKGVNYFYWGSLRRSFMGEAIRNLALKHRNELVVVIQSYARLGSIVVRSLERALSKLNLDYADVLLLGWHSKPPSARIVDAALQLKTRGLVKHLAVSGHNRLMFPELLDDPRFAIWHVRYNAVHRGAEREIFPHLETRRIDNRPGLVTFTTTRWGHLCDPKRTPPGERTPIGTDCYRFALSHPTVNVVLAGPSSLEQMSQALRALELGPMTEDELAWLRRVGDHIYERNTTARLVNRA
ncbi:MAG: aldo/keto reductase [bacterium]|nr:aldo/keto reductase [bacterium]